MERKLNLDDIEDIEVDGIDYEDYPDFCDAYVSTARWGDGRILSEEELDILNMDYREFVYQCVINRLY